MKKEERTLWAIDGFILVASIIFSALFLLGDQGDEAHAAAALLPNIVSLACILLSLSVIIMKVQGHRARKARAPMAASGAGTAPDLPAEHATPLLAWWWSFIAMMVYFLSILLIGFVWATFLYILVLPYFMQYKKWKVAVMTSVVVTGGMYLAFSVVLNIRLPTGILF